MEGGILNTYGLDSRESVKLSEEIGERLRRLSFRILTTLENSG
jgi:hypothetical protein